MATQRAATATSQERVHGIWSLAKTHMWNKGLILTVHKWNLCYHVTNVCWWWLLNHWFSGPVQSPLQFLSHPSFPKQNVHQVTNTQLTKKRGLLQQMIVVHVVRRQMLWFCSKWYRFPLNLNIYILNGPIQMFCWYGYCGSNKPVTVDGFWMHNNFCLVNLLVLWLKFDLKIFNFKPYVIIIYTCTFKKILNGGHVWGEIGRLQHSVSSSSTLRVTCVKFDQLVYIS